MSEVASRIPFEKGSYRKSWQATQEDQDAYDDLMRRKLNPQKPEYVQNNELICFGVSEHTLEENIPQWNEKAISDFNIVRTQINMPK